MAFEQRICLFDASKRDLGNIERRDYERPLTAEHDDFELLDSIVEALLRHANGWGKFAEATATLMRRAVDEVIDTARTNRFTLSETEKTEKTYLGTKVEILFRAMLGISKGQILDLNVDGVEVDIKNTMGSNWAIPSEAVDRPCVLIIESESHAICSVGVVIARAAYLTFGTNKDGKRSVSASGKHNIWWILRNYPYPPNPWELLAEDERQAIMHAPGGADRVAALFERLQGWAISRTMVEHVAQQKDALKRVRRNGGARDRLAPKGIAILYGSNDRELISRLGLAQVGSDEFISHSPKTEIERALLREARHID